MKIWMQPVRRVDGYAHDIWIFQDNGHGREGLARPIELVFDEYSVAAPLPPPTITIYERDMRELVQSFKDASNFRGNNILGSDEPPRGAGVDEVSPGGHAKARFPESGAGETVKRRPKMISYAGKEPAVERALNLAPEVLKIFQSQLDLLLKYGADSEILDFFSVQNSVVAELGRTYIMIPEGTKIQELLHDQSEDRRPGRDPAGSDTVGAAPPGGEARPARGEPGGPAAEAGAHD